LPVSEANHPPDGRVPTRASDPVRDGRLLPSHGDGLPLVRTEGLTKHFPLRSTVLARLLAGARDRTVRAVDDVDWRSIRGRPWAWWESRGVARAPWGGPWWGCTGPPPARSGSRASRTGAEAV